MHAQLPLLPHRYDEAGPQPEPSEIVGQVMLARDALGEWPSSPDGRMLTNIVAMGMGEPLYNFDNVKQALKIMGGDASACPSAASPCRRREWSR